MKLKNALFSLFLIVSFILLAAHCTAQTAWQQINEINAPAVALAPLRFLASDELMGRSTTRPEINIAARYISEEFKSLGLKQVNGLTDYFQPFDINLFTTAKTGSVVINNKTFTIGNDLIQISGKDISITAPITYAGFGLQKD